MDSRSSLDTSLIVRFITNDIPEDRQKVIKLLKSGKKFCVSDIAISETMYVLQKIYGYKRTEAADNLFFFLTQFSDELDYNIELTKMVFPTFLAHPKLSFNDCCVAAYANLDNAEPLYTFDQKLAKQSPYAKELK